MTATTAKARKPKSPPVPSRPLAECFTDVTNLYERFSHASFSRSEVASALSVSADSGPFAQRLFTFREFGLLDADGNNYKVSALYKEMKSQSKQDPGFKRAALNAIRKSDVFRELLDDFTHKLPPVESVAQRLETQKHFNAERAMLAARVLEASLRFAGILDGSGNILPVREESDQGRHEGGETPDDEGVAQPDSLRLEIPLASGRIASIHVPPDLTEADAAKISNVLKAVSGASVQ